MAPGICVTVQTRARRGGPGPGRRPRPRRGAEPHRPRPRRGGVVAWLDRCYFLMCMCSMLSLLTPRQSDGVGGPIGSMREAKKVESYPNYDAAYLAKRLGAERPQALEHNRYKSANQFDSIEKEMVYLQNATKGYEAEAEECLKKEFKDWLAGVHEDNYYPKPYDNTKGGAIRRDMSGERMDSWVPTWWGPSQLTYLPGVREYLREEAMNADKNSLDMNKLAHLGPQNVEEAWAYFKHWVKGRPVGPEECLHPSPRISMDNRRPFRAGPTHMQHDTQYNADNPYSGSPYWPTPGTPRGTQYTEMYPPTSFFANLFAPAPPAPLQRTLQRQSVAASPPPPPTSPPPPPPTSGSFFSVPSPPRGWSRSPATTPMAAAMAAVHAPPLEASSAEVVEEAVAVAPEMVADVLARVLSPDVLSPIAMSGTDVQLADTPQRTSVRGISRTPQPHGSSPSLQGLTLIQPTARKDVAFASPSTGGSSYTNPNPYTAGGTALSSGVYSPVFDQQLLELRRAEANEAAAEAAEGSGWTDRVVETSRDPNAALLLSLEAERRAYPLPPLFDGTTRVKGQPQPTATRSVTKAAANLLGFWGRGGT